MIYYNFIRPHMSLNGKTPAEESGIDLNLGNKNDWIYPSGYGDNGDSEVDYSEGSSNIVRGEY